MVGREKAAMVTWLPLLYLSGTKALSIQYNGGRSWARSPTFVSTHQTGRTQETGARRLLLPSSVESHPAVPGRAGEFAGAEKESRGITYSCVESRRGF